MIIARRRAKYAAFLERLIATRGYFNRRDLVNKFDITGSNASTVIQTFLRHRGDSKQPKIVYSQGNRRYERYGLGHHTLTVSFRELSNTMRNVNLDVLDLLGQWEADFRSIAEIHSEGPDDCEHMRVIARKALERLA